MASYKVTIESGFTHDGKTYSKGDTINLSAAAAKVYANIDFIKEVGEKKASAPAKKAAPKKAVKVKGVDESNDSAPENNPLVTK